MSNIPQTVLKVINKVLGVILHRDNIIKNIDMKVKLMDA